MNEHNFNGFSLAGTTTHPAKIFLQMFVLHPYHNALQVPVDGSIVPYIVLNESNSLFHSPPTSFIVFSGILWSSNPSI